MAAIAQSLPGPADRLAWLCDLLRHEMAPYRGRVALVARMVTASTLVMIISMTFRIPYGAYGAIFALSLSRNSLEATASAVRAMAIGLPIAGAYVVLGSMLVLGNSMLRFVWVVVTLFLIFYVMSAMSSYAASARFAYLIVITIPLWDQQIPGEQKVEGTLWAVGAITLASVITLLLEIAFAAFGRLDDLTEGLTERLESVEELLSDYADSGKRGTAAQSAVTRLATVGSSRLRRILQRSGSAPQYAQQMGAVVALVGRLVDLAAGLAQLSSDVGNDDRTRLRSLAEAIAGVRADLARGAVPRQAVLPGEGATPAGLPLLPEMEKTVSLIPEVFTGSQSLDIYAPAPSDQDPPTTPLVPGALSNPEHVKFGLRGCFAASLCYITYNSLFWPGISTAITTCLLTALSTTGGSHQKQILRFTGALIGGVVIGMGAQIFILPSIDSIGAFTVLFAAVAAVAAWFATASSRLSYFGVQIAVAFCLINLEEFKIQTSLAAARDRVVGILLGLFMMWLAFDRFWSAPAGAEMKRKFISILRLLARFAREPVLEDMRLAIEQSYALRETINAHFDGVRSLSDGVLFEFGPARKQDLALRRHILQWDPQLRALFLMRIASWKYRLQLPGFELPDGEREFQQEFDDRSALMLEEMADRIEGQPHVKESVWPPEHFAQVSATPHIRSFRALLRGIQTLTTSLREEIAKEF